MEVSTLAAAADGSASGKTLVRSPLVPNGSEGTGALDQPGAPNCEPECAIGIAFPEGPLASAKAPLKVRLDVVAGEKPWGKGSLRLDVPGSSASAVYALNRDGSPIEVEFATPDLAPGRNTVEVTHVLENGKDFGATGFPIWFTGKPTVAVDQSIDGDVITLTATAKGLEEPEYEGYKDFLIVPGKWTTSNGDLLKAKGPVENTDTATWTVDSTELDNDAEVEITFTPDNAVHYLTTSIPVTLTGDSAIDTSTTLAFPGDEVWAGEDLTADITVTSAGGDTPVDGTGTLDFRSTDHGESLTLIEFEVKDGKPVNLALPDIVANTEWAAQACFAPAEGSRLGQSCSEREIVTVVAHETTLKISVPQGKLPEDGKVSLTAVVSDKNDGTHLPEGVLCVTAARGAEQCATATAQSATWELGPFETGEYPIAAKFTPAGDEFFGSAVEATLKVNRGSGESTTTPPKTTPVSSGTKGGTTSGTSTAGKSTGKTGGELAYTGAESGALVAFAVLLVAAGVATIALRRKSQAD
jgi:hypothetical protein